MMPGKIVSPLRRRAIRFSRSSSFTLRVRSRCSEKELFLSSPRVGGRFMKGLWRALYRVRQPVNRSMHMPIAAGPLARAQAHLNLGNGGAIVLRKGLNPLGLGLHLQQRLLEVQVHGQCVRQVK